ETARAVTHAQTDNCADVSVCKSAEPSTPQRPIRNSTSSTIARSNDNIPVAGRVDQNRHRRWIMREIGVELNQTRTIPFHGNTVTIQQTSAVAARTSSAKD